ncbi:heat shock factor 2-binding protein [Bombina bombina]|uniref:heat shock factor 2-binding protein n=1 Tax=Bombina bombina TaxID=8345 RepID=UPI00235A681E|nr:heat shock factor 2-binding protein [Bombina bombina]
MSSSSGEEFIRIRRRDLERLTTEVMQMKDFLPQILNQELVETVQRLEHAETALEGKNLDCEHFRCRLEAAQSECLQEREEKLSLLTQLNTVESQSMQQAEYCTHLGATVCTMLWGVSNKEEAVQSILEGGKASMFFSMAAHTVSSFVELLGTEQSREEESEEHHFVLGLAGTITNIAAVSYGRDYLVSSCTDLLGTWIHLLGEIRLGTCNRLRILMLMSLYNVSINQSGLSWMSQNRSCIMQLQRLITDPDTEVCMHALRLLQSVLLESDVLRSLWADLRTSLPRIIELSQSTNRHLQGLACELLEDMKALEVEGWPQSEHT